MLLQHYWCKRNNAHDPANLTEYRLTQEKKLFFSEISKANIFGARAQSLLQILFLQI